jgi:hypothetical protein
MDDWLPVVKTAAVETNTATAITVNTRAMIFLLKTDFFVIC